MSVYARRNYDDGQVLFNRILFAFTIVIKLALKLIIYSPLLFIGWLITKQMLDVSTNAILSIALILIFATLTYFIIYFFKFCNVSLIRTITCDETNKFCYFFETLAQSIKSFFKLNCIKCLFSFTLPA